MEKRREIEWEYSKQVNDVQKRHQEIYLNIFIQKVHHKVLKVTLYGATMNRIRYSTVNQPTNNVSVTRKK